MLYFAYGSNLHHFQMKRRCKDSLFLKKINLKDFKLTFRSKYRAADIEAKKNSVVPGALFEISKSDEKKLDGYEANHTIISRNILKNTYLFIKAFFKNLLSKSQSLYPFFIMLRYLSVGKLKKVFFTIVYVITFFP